MHTAATTVYGGKQMAMFHVILSKICEHLVRQARLNTFIKWSYSQYFSWHGMKPSLVRSKWRNLFPQLKMCNKDGGGEPRALKRDSHVPTQLQQVIQPIQ